MGQAIVFADTPRRDVDESVAEIIDLIQYGSLADKVLDAVFDVENGDARAARRASVRKAARLYEQFADALTTQPDFFTVDPSARTFRLNSLKVHPEDPTVNRGTEGRRLYWAKHFRAIASALSALRAGRADGENLKAVRDEFTYVAEQTLIEGRQVSDKSLRTAPWAAR